MGNSKSKIIKYFKSNYTDINSFQYILLINDLKIEDDYLFLYLLHCRKYDDNLIKHLIMNSSIYYIDKYNRSPLFLYINFCKISNSELNYDIIKLLSNSMLINLKTKKQKFTPYKCYLHFYNGNFNNDILNYLNPVNYVEQLEMKIIEIEKYKEIKNLNDIKEYKKLFNKKIYPAKFDEVINLVDNYENKNKLLDCPVCFTNKIEDFTSCYHCFCEICINKYNDICPICRKNII